MWYRCTHLSTLGGKEDDERPHRRYRNGNKLCYQRVVAETLEKKKAASVLWDMSHFYDSVEWEPIVEVAIATGYDMTVLALPFPGHLRHEVLPHRSAPFGTSR